MNYSIAKQHSQYWHFGKSIFAILLVCSSRTRTSLGLEFERTADANGDMPSSCRCLQGLQFSTWNDQMRKSNVAVIEVTFGCLSCPLIISIANENSSFFWGDKLHITKVVLSGKPLWSKCTHPMKLPALHLCLSNTCHPSGWSVNEGHVENPMQCLHSNSTSG